MVHTLNFISQIQFKVSHIFKEANKLAGLLSKARVTNSSNLLWDSIPDWCLSAHNSDLCNGRSFKLLFFFLLLVILVFVTLFLFLGFPHLGFSLKRF